MRSYHIAQHAAGPVFFDRGVPDVLGYLRLSGVPAPGHMERAAAVFRYYRRVFITPPWQEIFQQDRERKQDLDETVRTYDVLVAAYTMAMSSWKFRGSRSKSESASFFSL